MTDKKGEIISFKEAGDRIRLRKGRLGMEESGVQLLPPDTPFTGTKVTLDNFDEIFDKALFAERAAETKNQPEDSPQVQDAERSEGIKNLSGAKFNNGPEILKDNKGSGY